jgi:heterodisulfide reductase subunit A-like polyferredoxin
MYESPYQTTIPGLFIAGGIAGPKTIEETLADARAVTSDIKAYLKKIENFAGHESYILEL